MGSPQVINGTVSIVSGVESSSVIINWMGPGGDRITTNCRVAISHLETKTTSVNDTYTSSLKFDYLVKGDEGMYTCDVMVLKTSRSISVQMLINCKQYKWNKIYSSLCNIYFDNLIYT